MEERCTREVLDRDTAIEALKAENGRLEGEKGGLANSLAALRLSLNDLAEGLRRELTSEKESASAVEQQLSLATRRLDSVKGVLAATIA